MKYRKFHHWLNVQISTNMRNQIEEIAEMKELSMSDVVREILSDALEKKHQVIA